MADSGTELLAADGDVILVVGPEKKCIRVCSVTLSRASSVFAALFGPQFREGQQARSSSAPVDIALPDDDADDFLFVCRVLHFRTPRLEEAGLKEGAKKLLSLAIVVDKYALTHAFMYAARTLMTIWLDSHHQNIFTDDCNVAKIATAAYLFDEPHCFKLATRRLIKDTNSNITLLCTQDCAQLLPTQVLVGIAECRNKTLNCISERIACHELDEDVCDACSKASITYYDTLRKFWHAESPTLRRNLNNNSEFTITYHIEKLRSIADEVYESGEGCSQLCHICHNSIPCIQFYDIAAEAEEESAGFCLMCVKSNANVLGTCTNRH
ncbi:uncharacterized protein RHO25_003660 [Cercospora beticola]|uniref:BTB domain-containing protein n=1 Tax=Cercospora beticola TaxID=122368 RepID=A0ABZ0NHN3_CERBT|nr:hypothetical protein RHO25_003660 [Cercospora beticola]CAK1360352.1 unnamed protein product [Cercospora beticola]